MKIVYEFSTTHNKKEDISLQVLFHDRWKFKILWQLRDLEDELEDEKDGVIMIPALGTAFIIELRGFSDNVADKIEKRLLPFFKN